MKVHGSSLRPNDAAKATTGGSDIFDMPRPLATLKQGQALILTDAVKSNMVR